MLSLVALAWLATSLAQPSATPQLPCWKTMSRLEAYLRLPQARLSLRLRFSLLLLSFQLEAAAVTAILCLNPPCRLAGRLGQPSRHLRNLQPQQLQLWLLQPLLPWIHWMRRFRHHSASRLSWRHFVCHQRAVQRFFGWYWESSDVVSPLAGATVPMLSQPPQRIVDAAEAKPPAPTWIAAPSFGRENKVLHQLPLPRR